MRSFVSTVTKTAAADVYQSPEVSHAASKRPHDGAAVDHMAEVAQAFVAEIIDGFEVKESEKLGCRVLSNPKGRKSGDLDQALRLLVRRLFWSFSQQIFNAAVRQKPHDRHRHK